jgi:hypothetical protein
LEGIVNLSQYEPHGIPVHHGSLPSLFIEPIRNPSDLRVAGIMVRICFVILSAISISFFEGKCLRSYTGCQFREEHDSARDDFHKVLQDEEEPIYIVAGEELGQFESCRLSYGRLGFTFVVGQFSPIDYFVWHVPSHYDSV